MSPADDQAAVATALPPFKELPQKAPDVSIEKAADGTYYAYSTQTFRNGKPVNIPVYTSADLVSWKPAGDAMPRPTARLRRSWRGARRSCRGGLLHSLSDNESAVLAQAGDGGRQPVGPLEHPLAARLGDAVEQVGRQEDAGVHRHREPGPLQPARQLLA